MDFMTTSRKIETLSIDRSRKWLADREEGEIIVLDVRQPKEYISGHLPGAVLIPLPDLLDRAAELDNTKPVLAYCRSGNRSRAAAALLLTEGFSTVYSLEGGISAWNGDVAMGDYRQGMNLLKGGETAEELILLAWSLEDGSRLFYERAAHMTSDNESKDLFLSLAGAEMKHKANVLKTFKMVTGKEPAEDFGEKSLKGLMEGGEQVEEAIAFVNSRGRTLPDLIEISMQVETNALDLYIKMLREIENEDAAKVFASLIEEEKRHLARLGELLGGKTM